MFDEERFKILLGDYFDESLKGNDRVIFEEMLKTTAKARELFWEAAEQHALAREWALASIGMDRAALIAGDGENVVEFRPERMSWRRWVIPALAVAAALAVGFVFLHRGQLRTIEPGQVTSETETLGPIAMIALSSEARWEVPDKERLPNDELEPGPLRLLSGTIRIDFYGGAMVWVRGPAEVDLVSQNEVRLDSGDLIAEVPPAAIGFKVISGDSTITDLGTEFGVSRVDGVNEVHVFDGRVALNERASVESEILVAGQAVRIEKGIRSQRSADYSRFPDRRAIEQKLESERETRFSEWTEKTAEFSRQRDTLVHYLFSPGDGGGSIRNSVRGASEGTDGTLIGGEWSTGRWDRKPALSFNREGDRVRLVVPGEHQAMTILTWVRLDELPEGLAGVLRAEEMIPGALRLGIDDLGRLRMGVYTPDTTFISPQNRTPFQWDVAMSDPIMFREIGRWAHIAAVYDSSKRIIEIWLNGERIARKNLRYGFSAKIGVAQIGSALPLGEPVKRGRSIRGRMDEFAIVGKAFTAAEIRDHYRQGKPRDAKNMADPAGW